MTDASTEATVDATVYYVHFPLVAVPSPGFDVLEGRLLPFAFEEFAAVDRDWANRKYFDATQPAVWRCSEAALQSDRPRASGDPDAVSSEPLLEEVVRRAGLIYNALLLVTPDLLPDPKMSVLYVRRGRSWSRHIGPYERTYLLNGVRAKALDAAQSTHVAANARLWLDGGLSPQAKVFGPLRGLSILASQAIAPEYGIAPLLVSLEGYVLGQRTRGGIAAALAKRLMALLGERAPDDLPDRVRRLYAWRSELVHGRPLTDTDPSDMFRWMCWLVRAVVAAGTERTLGASTDGNDLSVVRAQLDGTDG